MTKTEGSLRTQVPDKRITLTRLVVQLVPNAERWVGDGIDGQPNAVFQSPVGPTALKEQTLACEFSTSDQRGCVLLAGIALLPITFAVSATLVQQTEQTKYGPSISSAIVAVHNSKPTSLLVLHADDLHPCLECCWSNATTSL